MDNRSELKGKREEIIRIATAFGARDVRVFPSVVRENDAAHTEFDFLVTLEPERSLFDLGGLLSALQQLLGNTTR